MNRYVRALKNLIEEVYTPSGRDEDAYTWAVIGIAHALLGAVLHALVGWLIPFARLAIAVGYWVIKERKDLKNKAMWRDCIVDTLFVYYGTFYEGPIWWPILLFGTIAYGAYIHELNNLKETR